MILRYPIESDQLDQGCIIKGISHPSFECLDTAVVLNPTCQFAQGKADSVILAYIIPAKLVLDINEQWLDFVNNLPNENQTGSMLLSNSKKNSVEKIIGRLIDNDEPRRYFFIGCLGLDIDHSFVDFQQIASFTFDNVHINSKIIAKLNNPFLEQLATNFAGYMMRIGVDRYNGTNRAEVISTLISPIKY